MFVAVLALLAVALAWPVPRIMAGFTEFRHAPRAALVVWQASAVTAVLAALATAPAALSSAIGTDTRLSEHLGPVIAAAAVTGYMVGRLLLSGHRVGSTLRANRRKHRELVDLLGTRDDTQHAHMRVIEHPTPTAYCVPGLQRRVVLTQGTIDALPERELEAVLAHERAHLVSRHDLVLEFFMVMHEAVPPFVRSHEALREVNLLIEVLADRAAVRATDVLTTARAIAHMASGPKPEGTMAMNDDASAARLRLGLLERTRVLGLPLWLAATLMYLFAASLVAMPLALLLLARSTPY